MISLLFFQSRRDEDVERQALNNDGVDSKEKKTTTKTFLDPEGQFLRIWRMIFVVSCMMAVSVDPLFFYLPVINEKNKCFVLDERLKVVAICLRTATDLIYVVNIILQFLCPYIDETASKLGRIKVVTDSWPIAKRYFLSRYFPIDILAILPLPQVLIPIIFSEIRGSESLHIRKLLNTVVLYQYVPRLIRISMFIRAANKHSRVVRVKAALNLFLYIMASHTYMQLITERTEEIIQKMKSKERDIELWISRNGLNDDIKREIMANIRQVLEHNIDVDAKNPLPHLPAELTREIKCHLCLPLLKKVPMLETESERLLQSLCDSLKPVYYNERSYIVREGEPIDAMLFITQGIVCNFGTSTVRGDVSISLSSECLERGHFFGEELLDWGFRGSPTPNRANLSDLPISTKTFKTHTKVEAFALMANDLRTQISWWQTQSKAASTLQAAWRRFRVKKNSDMSTHLAIRRPN